MKDEFSQRHKDSCKKKIPYDSKKEINAIIRNSRNKNQNKTLSSYRCPICGFWHLTSCSKSKNKRLKKQKRRLEAFQKAVSQNSRKIN
jgi:hypothetical protein